MARYTVETPAGTKRRTVYGKTRGEVRDKLAKALAERADGLVFDDENMTVGEYVTRWLEDSGLVFATAKGTPLDAQNVVNRHFKPLLRRAGLPDIRWHDLRHSSFTLLLSRGVHPKFVQHLAGHASIQLTLDRYSHWMPTMGKHTASAMDEALDEADREGALEDEKGALER
jgi:integrase